MTKSKTQNIGVETTNLIQEEVLRSQQAPNGDHLLIVQEPSDETKSKKDVGDKAEEDKATLKLHQERKKAYHHSQQYLNTTIKKNDSTQSKAKR